MSKKTLYFDRICSMTAFACVEDGVLQEYVAERDGEGSLVGNIYKGVVCNVLTGMQAAFINCGLERNCYLPLNDSYADQVKYDGNETDTPTLDLKEGDEVLVQIVKPPINKKGAKVSTHLTFVGNSSIYLPNTSYIGISRKITDAELRKNLLITAQKVVKENEGLVVRTAAPFSSRKQKLAELTYLRNLYNKVMQDAQNAPVGTLLYSDAALPLRIMRDYLSHEVERIIVGSETVRDEINSFLSLHPSDKRCPIELARKDLDLFEEAGLTPQIASILSPRVDLGNGAYLIIERTEALTVIDVNTGKFVGDDNLEETVYHTNLHAAREIARQVRLRNIGGIVVVDFIDMDSVSHERAVTEELKTALSSDKAKCNVLPMSDFGLIEFTRKRVGSSVLSRISKQCKHCHGAGYIRTNHFILMELRAQLLRTFSQGVKNIVIDINNDVARTMTEWTDWQTDVKSRYPDAQVYAVPHRTYHEEKYTYHPFTHLSELPFDAIKIL